MYTYTKYTTQVLKVEKYKNPIIGQMGNLNFLNQSKVFRLF